MSEEDDQKTRIQRRSEPRRDDATVFSPKRPRAEEPQRAEPQKPQRAEPQEPQRAKPQKPRREEPQKTQLQRPKRPQRDGAQSPRRETPSKPRADQTRFVPQARPDAPTEVGPGDKTRVDPGRPPERKGPSALELHRSAPHGLLKNRFILEEVLGTGGMGVVYKAKDRLKIEAQDKDPYVAIKVLSEEFKTHPEAFIALQRESRKTQRIAHPNIVNVHDFDRDGKTVFMTMEFLDGKPLDKLLAQYRTTGLPREDCLQILEGLCSALMYAHAENIIHSDLKPGNIFVTNRGIPKVFDFGIARAVAKAERTDDNPEDKTVFDAGNLGALTPAYASLEMLEGAPPDARDDLYALGCIAYEIFSGEHPFNRVHADEAQRQKLKPKRISGLTKQQWRAIEGCLSFRREDRLPSVEAFWSAFSTHRVAKLKYAVGALVIVASMATAAYQYRAEYLPQFSEQDVRTEIEQQLRLEMKRDNLLQLINDARFTPVWESEVWDSYRELLGVLGEPDIWLATQLSDIYQLYLDEVTGLIGDGELERAQEVLANAYRYTDEHGPLDELKQQIARAMDRQEKEAAEQEAARKAAENMAAKQNEKRQQQAQVNREFDAALANVDEQLACRQQLDMEDLEIAVNKLRELDAQRYDQKQGRIVSELADCIEFVGQTFSDRAQTFKQQAMQIFPNSARVAGIAITPKDPCEPSLAGMGARGPRASCRDAAPGVGTGPNLVVIPGRDGADAYAIGREEVSVEEYNRYCRANNCSTLDDQREDRPATQLSVRQAQAYLDWLSDSTGYRYRLPTEGEWHHAADAQGSPRDSNRNCQFESRGIQRGDSLAKVGVGRQNRWGLVNHIGNAREWVVRGGGGLLAAGGSFETPMEDCHLQTRTEHSGEPDAVTGFRVLRELKSD